MHTPVVFCIMHAKAFEGTKKNLHVITISKILGRLSTEIFRYCFIETFFVIHLKFCVDTEGM